MRHKRSGLWKSVLLPVLGAVYPIIFLYNHNVKIAPLESVVLPLAGMIVLGLVLFGLFWLVERKPAQAALSALLFLVFFHTYGAIYTRLYNLNRVQIEHYTLLPLVILVALYGAFFLSKLKRKPASQIQNLLLLVGGALVLFNVATAVPAELDKERITVVAKSAVSTGAAQANYPDVYYLIFDEYAGFEALHEYWRYDGYRDFISHLEEEGFFVAETSHSNSTDTLHEMASRLNLKVYEKPEDMKDANYGELFEAIADNKVMRLFKSYGYTTVVFDGPAIPYKTKKPVTADFNFMYEGTENTGEDEFTSLFLGQTMMRAFPQLYIPKEVAEKNPNRSMILYSLNKTPQLDEVPTPKFVYMHVMLPHMPIQFDENGNAIDFHQRLNWAYYLEQHKYATRRAQQLVDEILKKSDPNRPPVIILQSDHGARNFGNESPESVTLQNYDDKYKTSIMNAMLVPGYDTSQLPEDLSPMEPLKIVLNYYLNAGVEIEPADPKK